MITKQVSPSKRFMTVDMYYIVTLKNVLYVNAIKTRKPIINMPRGRLRTLIINKTVVHLKKLKNKPEFDYVFCFWFD